MKRWGNIPESIKNKNVYEYYLLLQRKKGSFVVKRVLDILLSVLLLVVIIPIILIICVVIIADSKGGAFFLQKRVTRYGREFNIIKLRTMVKNAEQVGTQVTSNNDTRVTRVGRVLRKLRIDEFPQLINILKGDMSFVGTRPEVKKYVAEYSNEMKATLLMRAGLTSLASIMFKDVEKLLENESNVDEAYIKKVLPCKMKYNLEYMKNFSVKTDLKLILKTACAVVKRDN
ncbi:MAG: sugar transferase [Christensenella sp.]